MPDTASVTMEDLKAAHTKFKMHMNLGDYHVSIYECVEYPQLGVVCRTPKNRRAPKDVPMGRFYVVAGIDQDFDTLADALPHLNAIRAAEAAEAMEGAND